MRAMRPCLSLAAVAALSLTLGSNGTGAPAFAADSSGPPSQIVAVYQVNLGGFNLGTFRLTANFRGGDYDMRGETRFSILNGLLYQFESSAASTGKITSTGPQPATYAVRVSDSGDLQQLRMVFTDGAVSEVAKVPNRPRSPRTIPVKKEQLEGVFDPMSGAFLYAHSDNSNGDPKVCQQTLPVFDGEQRFDLVLTPKRTVRVTKQSDGGYAGPAVICQVKFVPIAGYQPDDPGIRLMSQTNEIEVWLVPLRGTEMYVPYRIVLPTLAGEGQALATSFEIRGVQHASYQP